MDIYDLLVAADMICKVCIRKCVTGSVYCRIHVPLDLSKYVVWDEASPVSDWALLDGRTA